MENKVRSVFDGIHKPTGGAKMTPQIGRPVIWNPRHLAGFHSISMGIYVHTLQGRAVSFFFVCRESSRLMVANNPTTRILKNHSGYVFLRGELKQSTT